MKQTLFFCGLAAALTLTAAPTPAWVPADADLVVVSQTLADAETVKAVTDRYTTIQRKFLGMDAQDAETLDVLIEELGFRDPDQYRSQVLSVTFPVDAMPRMIAFAETRDITADKITAALKKADAASDEKISLTERDGWTLIASPGEEKPTLAYRSEGTLIMLATPDATAAADALYAGTGSALAKDSPLTTAFVLPKGGDAVSTTRFVLADVGGLVKRFVKPEDMTAVTGVVPELPALSVVTLSGTVNRDAVCPMDLTVKAADSATATALRDRLIGLKMMALMGLSQSFPPESALTALLQSIRVDSREEVASLSLTVTPDICEALFASLEPFCSVTACASDDDGTDTDGPAAE